MPHTRSWMAAFLAAIFCTLSLFNCSAFAHSDSYRKLPASAQQLTLDPTLEPQWLSLHDSFGSVNSTFGSRFDFNPYPGGKGVWSGTYGAWHDSFAPYVVGVTPTGGSATDLYQWGGLASGDSYLANQKWYQGMVTTRFQGDSPHQSALHLSTDVITPFVGMSECTIISSCAQAVENSTLPVELIGVTLDNGATTAYSGSFVFGSNRALSGYSA